MIVNEEKTAAARKAHMDGEIVLKRLFRTSPLLLRLIKERTGMPKQRPRNRRRTQNRRIRALQRTTMRSSRLMARAQGLEEEIFPTPPSEWPYPEGSTADERRRLRKDWEQEGVDMLEMKLELGL